MRQAVSNRHIPILLYEAGEALRFDAEAIRVGVEGILRVMNALEMYPLPPSVETVIPQEVSQSKWIRASHGGIFLLQVKLGQLVEKKQILGLITDAFGHDTIKVKAPFQGIVIGHIQNPLVNQGDAIIHLAIASSLGLSA
jgi:predicted deacylase